jgi:hypothetical protein
VEPAGRITGWTVATPIEPSTVSVATHKTTQAGTETVQNLKTNVLESMLNFQKTQCNTSRLKKDGPRSCYPQSQFYTTNQWNNCPLTTGQPSVKLTFPSILILHLNTGDPMEGQHTACPHISTDPDPAPSPQWVQIQSHHPKDGESKTPNPQLKTQCHQSCL